MQVTIRIFPYYQLIELLQLKLTSISSQLPLLISISGKETLNRKKSISFIDDYECPLLAESGH
jgi:hypothetical protein